MKSYTLYIYTRARRLNALLLAAVLLLAACATSDGDGRTDTVAMPVYISIPATDVDAATRTPGDPGTYERFGLPRYLCLMMTERQTDGTYRVTARVMNMDLGEGPDNWRRFAMNDVNNPAGTPTMPTATYGGDSIYTYVGRQLTVNLPGAREGKTAEIYAAMSPRPFMRDGAPLTADDIATRDDLLNLTVDFDPDPAPSASDPAPSASGSAASASASASASPYAYLRDVYSTPYNLRLPAAVSAGSPAEPSSSPYYGTLDAETYQSSYPELRLVLYHVAAKLDLQWNVTDPVIKAAGGIKQLTVSGLKHTGCHLFKPMTNVGAGDTPYDITFSTDQGNAYYGRHSVYVVPYVTSSSDATMPVAMKAEWGDAPLTLTATHAVPLNTDAVFTPWIVGALTK